MSAQLVPIDPGSGQPVGPSYDYNGPGTFFLGREPSCTYVVNDDPVVSRKHFMIEIDPPGARLHDLGSRNGVRVNEVLYGGKTGLRATDGSVPPLPLTPGDRIRVGRTTLEFRARAEPVRKAFPAQGIGGAANMIAAATTGERPPPDIAGYQIGRLLGKGGMGAVYHAVQQTDGLEVAVKVMLMGGIANEKTLGRFQREIAISRTLEHENIVTCLEDGSVDDQLYLIMEYIPHGCLARRLGKGGPMTPTEALPYLRQMLMGLAHAHERQFVHRDLKPANVLLGGLDGRTAKLTDFGLAKSFVDAGLSGFTRTGTAAGTATCLPPEQLTHFRHVLPSADVFALGATFYEMITGRSPYNLGPGADAVSVVLSYDLTPLAKLRPDLPAALISFVDRALSREAEDRYRDAGEMLSAYDAMPPL